jgi:bifunctional UDP-N-acetylglucosamine pyrophosphorylase/glucosamine-1-phosphate N-acetyltransferase
MTRYGKADIAAIILAAGKGTRMQSETPKVLHKVCGTPMLERIMQTVEKTGIKKFCLVLGESPDLFNGILERYSHTTSVMQENRLGTGDAVAATACAFKGVNTPSYASGRLTQGSKLEAGYVLICAGDTPALDPEVLGDFVDKCLEQNRKLGLIGIHHPEPTGYGRLLCNKEGLLEGIVEEKDASDHEKRLNLVNSGVIFAETKYLFHLLDKIDCENAQGEYYLTDCFAVAAREKDPAYVYNCNEYRAFSGVNARSQLVAIETWLMQKRAESFIASGVTIHLPETCYIEDGVAIEPDTDIGAHCSLLGSTKIARGATIGAHCVLNGATITENSVVPAGSRLTSLDN